jgi:glycosyltransferase involved in cell wall biosynthesis
MTLSRPLHIAIVTPGWTPPGGPDALPALADTVRLLAERHSVRIVALRYPHGRLRYAWDGVEVVALGGGTRAGGLGRATLLGRAVETVRRLHRVRPIDVIHGFWADEPGAIAVMAGASLGCPTVVSVLGGELVADSAIAYGASLGLGGRLAVAFALWGASAVTVGSTVLRADVQRRSGRVADLVPLGIDLERFRPARRRAGERQILWVGSLEPVKDPVTALRAFARVAHDDPRLVLAVVGDGSLRPGLERLAGRLRVGDRVRFEGTLPRVALADRYRSADALLVSSRHEAQSMVAAEAAACGLPLVGTRVGSLPDLGDGAETVPVGDVGALAKALAGVMGDEPRRRAMGAAARAAAIGRFDLRVQVARMEAIYRSVVDGART